MIPQATLTVANKKKTNKNPRKTVCDRAARHGRTDGSQFCSTLI